jgi:hypothetical protein
VKYFSSGHLIFEGVEASMRELSGYAVKPNVNQFKSNRVIQDGPFPRVEGNKETFRFMGCSIRRVLGRTGLCWQPNFRWKFRILLSLDKNGSKAAQRILQSGIFGSVVRI